MTGEEFESDFTKLPVEIVLDLINAVNDSSLDRSSVSFGIPVPNQTTFFPSNTQIEVTGKAGKYDGSEIVYYDRVPFSDISEGLQTAFVVKGPTRISALIPQINARYGVNLQPEDYFDDYILFQNEVVSADTDFILKAKPNSLVWIGQVKLTAVLLP